jgi:hypothetical protein
MKRLGLFAFAIACILSCYLIGKDKPAKNTLPLTEDEIAIYRAVLQHYGGEDISALNVSVRTYPFEMNSFSNENIAGCLKGIKLDNLPAIQNAYHELTNDILLVKNLTLVDPTKHSKIVRKNDPSITIAKGKSVNDAVSDAFSSALFSMSEIAFDQNRNYAVISYSFYCGSLCGNGATLLLKKENGEWKLSRSCSNWIS